MGVPAEEGQIRRAQRWRVAGPCSQYRLCAAPEGRQRERLTRQPRLRQLSGESEGSSGVPDAAVGLSEHWGNPGARQEEEGEAPQARRAYSGAAQAQHPAHRGSAHATHC